MTITQSVEEHDMINVNLLLIIRILNHALRKFFCSFSGIFSTITLLAFFCLPKCSVWQSEVWKFKLWATWNFIPKIETQQMINLKI